MIRQIPFLLFNRRWWWVTLLVIVGVAVMIRLSIWQVDRLQQRRAANELLRQQLEAPALSLNEVDLQTVDLTELPDRRAVATGTFDFSEQILLKVQNFRGSAGSHLVAPLRLAGRDEVVLVDRGWIPESQSAPALWEQFAEPGKVTVQGVIQRTQTARGVEPPAQPQQEWFRIDIEAIERQLPYEVLPVFLLQSPTAEGNQELPYREEAEVDLSEGPHLSYALQWAIFASMLAIGYVTFVYRQEKQGHEEEEAQAPPSPK